MTTFQKEDIDLAKKYSVNPIGMIGILRVYETLSRFVGYSKIDVDASITEEVYHNSYKKPPKYTYYELPYEITIMVKSIISKWGNVENFLNSKNSKHNFILGFIKKRYQPKDFLFRGVLTFRYLMRGDYVDNTRGYVMEVEYEM